MSQAQPAAAAGRLGEAPKRPGSTQFHRFRNPTMNRPALEPAAPNFDGGPRRPWLTRAEILMT
jgi:hypothetical protein